MTIFCANIKFSNLLLSYLPRSNHCINMADCKKKRDKELTFFENLTKKSLEGVYSSFCKHINAQTNDITSDAKNLDIFIISAALFNTIVW